MTVGIFFFYAKLDLFSGQMLTFFLNSLCTFCQILKKELSCLGTLAREGKTCNDHISNSFFGVCAENKGECYYYLLS